MGNGRWLGKSGERKFGEKFVWIRILGATFVLLAAGSVLLGLGSRYVQKTHASLPASHAPALSRSSLSSLPPSSRKPEARSILGQLPLIFEPNQGQAGPGAKFLARGSGYTLFLETTGAVLATQTANAAPPPGREHLVGMKLVGASPSAILTGADPLPGKSNYLIGNDPQKWQRGVSQFAGVHYAGVYPGIDLVFYGHQGHLEYDFRVAPGADPSRAELEFEGAKKLKLNGGDLILADDEEGGLRLQAPQIYQRDGDRHTPVAGRFVLRANNRVGFEIGPYDRARELIIDPVLSFSTYFGGSGSETSPSVAVDNDGSIYIAGTTTGSPVGSFPPATPQSLIGPLTLSGTSPSHIFVARIIPTQPPTVAYETFLGGTGTDTSIGIGVDGGYVYLVGNTDSTDFPAVGTNVLGYQTSPETKTQCTSSPTCTSVFVSVLAGNSPIPGGTLSYSTYLSGNGDDQASGMTIDADQDVFITGTTTSNNEPTTDSFPATQVPQPYQTTPLASIAFFVTKVSTIIPSSSGIAYSTYFGGATPAPPIAIGGGIAVDTVGNIYFSGTTNFYNSGNGPYGSSNNSQTDFPILGAYQPCLDTPPPTVLPSSNPCSSTGFATPFPTDAFVAKINPLAVTGAQLLFSTYFGGSATETGAAIAIDSAAQNIYLTGETNSPGSPTTGGFIFPTSTTPFQLCLDAPSVTVLPCPAITTTPVPFDAYVARMSNPTQSTTGIPNDVQLTYFTYLGGGGNDSATAIAVLDSSSTTLDDVVVTGTTNSGTNATAGINNPPNFPTTAAAIQSQLYGAQNAFYAEIDTTTVVGQNQAGSFSTYYGGNGMDRGTGVAVDPNLNSYFVGDTTSTNLQVENWVQGGNQLNGPSDAFVVQLGTAANLCITCVAPILSPLGEVSAGNQVTATFTVTDEGPDPATNVLVTGQVPSGVTFNSATAGSGTCSPPSSSQVICLIPTLQSGSASTVAFAVTPIASGSYSVTATASSSNNTGTDNTDSVSFTAGAYSLQVSPPARTVSAGATAQYYVNLSPTQGTFPANVALTCGGLIPTGVTCGFTSSSVSLGNGPQSVLLNLATTAQPQTTITSAPLRHAFYAVWLVLPGMAWLGVGVGGKRRGSRKGKRKGMTSRLLGLLALFLFFGLALLQPGCSTARTQPQVAGTPSGTYSLNITATSGSLALTQPITLTVVP